jgi:PAS domain-containing protein
MDKNRSKERLDQKIKQLEREILKHRGTEEKLLEKQAELITILENSPPIMLLVDREKRVQNAAQALHEFTGKREDEILGRPGG